MFLFMSIHLLYSISSNELSLELIFMKLVHTSMSCQPKNRKLIAEFETQFLPNGMGKALKIRIFGIHQYCMGFIAEQDKLNKNIQGVSSLSGHALGHPWVKTKHILQYEQVWSEYFSLPEKFKAQKPLTIQK